MGYYIYIYIIMLFIELMGLNTLIIYNALMGFDNGF